MSAEIKYQNHLINEKSPYLLQHAHNPVNWYPWGEEAFAKAVKEDKPIFLSIGYSTCHWCHVMAHESFENEDVAKKINEYFIPIKVDREERPDIDHIYMSAVTAMTGQGGWPLTLILTPNKEPFFGGTYFSPYEKWGQPGLMDIMESVHRAWIEQRENVLASSQSLIDTLKQERSSHHKKERLTKSILETAFRQFSSNYDQKFGGFGHSPKFPMGHNLSFLLRYSKQTSNAEALEIVENTLTTIAQSGTYDHLGGGFHRYATDQEWQVPHFEKMLYDQAILTRTYLEAFQITKKEKYAQTVREVFDYVLRDMQDQQGGFYSAEDADSIDPDEFEKITLAPGNEFEKKEGSFYLWRQDEIFEALGKDAAEIFNYYYGIRPNGNAHQDPHGEFTGKNIIYTEHDLEQTAKYFKKSEDAVSKILKESKQKLFDVQKKRPRPHLDDKVLTDWNGLMIASLAFGGMVLDEPKYVEAAEQSAQFILKNLITKKGRLLHRYRDGESAIDGTLEDYAFFIHGLLDLYEATFKLEYLKEAIRLADAMVDLFWDDEHGGFFLTADDAEKLLFRPKELYDGAIPSGNSFAALDLVRLYHLTLDNKWEHRLEELVQAFSTKIELNPSAYGQMLSVLTFIFDKAQEMVIAVKDESEDSLEMHKIMYDYFLPHRVILRHDSSDVAKIAPFVEGQVAQDGKVTVYVCEDHVCKKPVKKVEELRKILEGM